MAMIQCPECGMEISDKAKNCIHCGKVMIEEVIPHKYCSECGKEIGLDAEMCPYCGCPVEEEKKENVAIEEITKKVHQNKKPIMIGAAVAAVLLLLVLIINFAGSTLNEHEQLAYQNAVELKSMMRDPDSFKLYDEMFQVEVLEEDGSVVCTYTIFEYGGANAYGAITTDQAVFKDGTYLMDWADGPDEDDSLYTEQLGASIHLNAYQFTGDGDRFRTIDINIDKIKDKMGME